MKVRFIHLWFLLLACKVVVGVWLPFSTDEAYYWVWGQHPQLSYFDHPGMVGWLFWLGSQIDFLAQSSRLPGILLGHLTLLIWWQILKPYLDEKALCLWLLFISLSPLWGIGSIIQTPDVPLLFFWSLSLWFFMRALQSRHWTDYAWLGVSLGLGFCSKYHIVLFIPSALLALHFQKKWSSLRWQALLPLVFFGVVFSMPVLIWNWQNHFASFSFQLKHGLDDGKPWQWTWPFEFILAQVGILFPTSVYYIWKNRKKMPLPLLWWFMLFPFLFFFMTSWRSKVEANWPIAAYPVALSFAFLAMRETKALKYTLGLWAALWLIVISQVAFPWLPVNEKNLKTYELKRYDVLIPIAEANPGLVWAGSYQMASVLYYRTRMPIYKLKGINRPDFFDFRNEGVPNVDRFTLLVDRETRIPKSLTDRGYKNVQDNVLAYDFRVVEMVRYAAPDQH